MDDVNTVQVLRNADWGWGVKFSGIKRYEGVMFNIISATGGGRVGGVQFPGGKTLRNT